MDTKASSKADASSKNQSDTATVNSAGAPIEKQYAGSVIRNPDQSLVLDAAAPNGPPGAKSAVHNRAVSLNLSYQHPSKG